MAAKKLENLTGAGIMEEVESKGIKSMSEKLESICPCYAEMDVLFCHNPNVTPIASYDSQEKYSLNGGDDVFLLDKENSGLESPLNLNPLLNNDDNLVPVENIQDDSQSKSITHSTQKPNQAMLPNLNDKSGSRKRVLDMFAPTYANLLESQHKAREISDNAHLEWDRERLEQQAHLNLKPKPGLQRSLSTESLGDLKEPGTLWIHSVPQDLVDSLLSKRQKAAHLVPQIAGIYLEVVPHFEPFVKYGARQLYGKYEFEQEKDANLTFAKVVNDTECLPQFNKLELNGYLTKSTTQLGCYPLLLEVVLKYTPEGHPNKTDIPKVVKMIREILTRVNVETGKSENRFNLAQLDRQLVFRQGEAFDLRLREEGRELIYKGQLKKCGGGGSDSAELKVYLFDHALLMVNHKNSRKSDNLKVYCKPIPLELLTVTGIGINEESVGGPRSGAQAKKSIINCSTCTSEPTGGSNNLNTIVHHQENNKSGYSIVLWATTWQARQKWLEKIETHEQNTVFEMITLSEGFFVGSNSAQCQGFWHLALI
ncbi:hypothetical protein O181_074078, partial [Austropuccinia psidii MF-1]|nr:hypothetical protein [Austropuccinia psidii MF-1]